MEDRRRECEKDAAAAREAEARTQKDINAVSEAKAQVVRRCEEIETKLLATEVCPNSLNFYCDFGPVNSEHGALCFNSLSLCKRVLLF